MNTWCLVWAWVIVDNKLTPRKSPLLFAHDRSIREDPLVQRRCPLKVNLMALGKPINHDKSVSTDIPTKRCCSYKNNTVRWRKGCKGTDVPVHNYGNTKSLHATCQVCVYTVHTQQLLITDKENFKLQSGWCKQIATGMHKMHIIERNVHTQMHRASKHYNLKPPNAKVKSSHTPSLVNIVSHTFITPFHSSVIQPPV